MTLRPFLLAFLLIGACMGSAQAEGVYRHFIWGATPQDVRQFETAIFYKEEEDSLFFLEQKKGQRALLRYDFQDGKLWRIRYDYLELYSANPQTLLENIMAEEQVLTKAYGEPARQQLVWKDSLYKNFPQFWGRALGSRDLRFETEWQKPDTRILLEAFRNPHDPFYTLGYTVENAAVTERQEQDEIFNVWQTP